jgi:hypothetical protein
MINTLSLFQQSRKSNQAWHISDLALHEAKQWCSVIALPVVGMLLLLLCLLLQGIFAEIGPWVLFIGVKLITKQLEKQQSPELRRTR